MASRSSERFNLLGSATNADGGADAGEGDGGALHVAQALRTLALEDTCGYCGNKGAGFKSCSVCKTHRFGLAVRVGPPSTLVVGGEVPAPPTAMAAGAGERLSIPGAATNAGGGANAGEGDCGVLHVAQALRTLALNTCVYCGKHGAPTRKRCSVCKQVWYCGTECQNANWKRHTKTCAPPLSTNEVRKKVLAAGAAGEWRGVLEWEGRMDEMMEGQPDATCNAILTSFFGAHLHGSVSTGRHHHDLSAITLAERRVDLLGKMERFRDQCEAMCALAESLSQVGKRQEAAGYYQRARAIARTHGFFSVECQACLGLGEEAVQEGRDAEGAELLRNALAALPRSEREDPRELPALEVLAAAPLSEGSSTWELLVLHALINALFKTDAIEELGPLVLRYREAAKAQSVREGRLSVAELESVYFSARLHEAHGEPGEAARDVRALLDLMRENRAAVQDRLLDVQEVLRNASSRLEILHPDLGEEELIQSVARWIL